VAFIQRSDFTAGEVMNRRRWGGEAVLKSKQLKRIAMDAVARGRVRRHRGGATDSLSAVKRTGSSPLGGNAGLETSNL
jgi:hypothetical protein